MKLLLKNILSNDVELVDKIMKELDRYNKFKCTSDPVVFKSLLKSTDNKKTYSKYTEEVRSFEYAVMGNNLMVVNPEYFDENSIAVIQKHTNTIKRKFNGVSIGDEWDYVAIIYIPSHLLD